MRLSIGFGLGPLRVSQGLGLPRVGGSSSRTRDSGTCTVNHRTWDTENRCPGRHPDGFAANAEPLPTGVKKTMLAVEAVWIALIMGVIGGFVNGVDGAAHGVFWVFVLSLLFVPWARRKPPTTSVPSSGQRVHMTSDPSVTEFDARVAQVRAARRAR